MTLFVKKKKPAEVNSAPSPDNFSLFVSHTKNADGEDSVAEVLVPEKGPDDGRRGLFLREPKNLVQPARLPLKDVTDVEEVPAPAPTPKQEEKQAPAAKSEAPVTQSEKPAPKFGGLKFKDYTPPSHKEEPKLTPTQQPVEPEVSALQGAAVSEEASPVEAPPAALNTEGTSDADKSSLKSLFAKKSGKAAEDKPAVSAEPKKSFFGKAKRAESAAAPPAKGKPFAWGKKNESSSAKAKSESVARKVKPSKGALHILVDLDGQSSVYFEVTPEGLRQLPATEVLQAASFSGKDRRFSVDKKTSYQQAVDVAMSEVGDEVRIIHAAKSMGAVYATSVERVNETPVKVGPGLMLLEKVLKMHTRPMTAHVICLLLTDSSTQRSLAVLYHVSGQGDIAEPQVTVNPNNLAFTLGQFMTSRGLSQDAQVLQISNAELVSVAAELQSYPAEAVWNGVPVRGIAWAGVAVLALAAIASTGYAGMQRVELMALHAKAKSLKSDATRVDRKNEALIASSLVSYGQLQSLDVARFTDRAAAFWVPRATVTADATPTHEEYTLVMPMNGGAYFNNRPSVLAQLQNEDVKQLLELTPPEGCTKNIPGVSGGVNVLQITINCESPPSSIGRYRLD